MPCGWEDNRRSGVTLAMRHRLQRFIYLRAQGLGKGDEHPAYTPRGVRRSLLSRRIFPILYIVFKNAPTKTFRRGSWPPSKLSKAWFPQNYTPQTPCRLVQHSSLLWPTDRHTDHRTSVTIGRILYAGDADEFVMLTGQIRSSGELTPGERRLLAYLSAAKRSLVRTEVW